MNGRISSAVVLLQIYGISTASYGKKVSSTYQRYACGTFLPNSLYLRRLFAKVLEGCTSALPCQKYTALYAFGSKAILQPH